MITIVTSISPRTPSMGGLFLLIDVPNHLPQFNEKFVRVQQLGHDQAAVEWGFESTDWRTRGFQTRAQCG
jgi:hypothetical protein